MRRCIETASKKSLISYTDMMTELGLDVEDINDRNHFGELMGEVNDVTAGIDAANRRYLLTSVIVHKAPIGKMTMPGEGYFDLAKKLRMMDNENEFTFSQRIKGNGRE